MKITLILMSLLVAVICVCVLAIVSHDFPDTSLGRRVNAFLDKLHGAVKSKTIWFNVMALAFIQQLPSLVDYLAQNLPAVQQYLPANHAQTIIGAITIANLILRFKTTRPLEAK